MNSTLEVQAGVSHPRVRACLDPKVTFQRLSQGKGDPKELSRLKNPLVNGFSKCYHLRCENRSAEARRKRGGRSAEAKPFRRKRAEARGSVAEGSPETLVHTFTGVPG